jgi:hydrogenase maturation factor HypE
MTQSLEVRIRSIEEIDLRREISEITSFARVGAVFDSEKVRNRIARKYQLSLDDHETRSLGRSIGFVLTEMLENGLLDIYEYTAPIKYVRLKPKDTSFKPDVYNHSD